MADLNRANRECCDVFINDYVTKKLWLYSDFANTTTAGISSDNVYAYKKGSKSIAFSNPLEGTMSLEFQVHPFKVFALLSDGTLISNAIYPVKKTITCVTEGELDIEDTVQSGTVFVFPLNEAGGTEIQGTVVTSESGTKFTATTTGDVAKDESYDVCYYVVKETGVNRISFNNKKIPKAFDITMKTLDKNEQDELVPFLMRAYKATPQRKMDISWSSTGDPASITITFDLADDCDGNFLDMIEILE